MTDNKGIIAVFNLENDYCGIAGTVMDGEGGAAVPPAIALTGFVKGNTYTSLTTKSITASAGSNLVQGNTSQPSLNLKIGALTGQYNDMSSNNNTLTYNWNPVVFPHREINIKIVAYNVNNNRSELNIPVNVDAATSNTILEKRYTNENQAISSVLNPDAYINGRYIAIISLLMGSALHIRFQRPATYPIMGIFILQSFHNNGSVFGKVQFLITCQ